MDGRRASPIPGSVGAGGGWLAGWVDDWMDGWVGG